MAACGNVAGILELYRKLPEEIGAHVPRFTLRFWRTFRLCVRDMLTKQAWSLSSRATGRVPAPVASRPTTAWKDMRSTIVVFSRATLDIVNRSQRMSA